MKGTLDYAEVERSEGTSKVAANRNQAVGANEEWRYAPLLFRIGAMCHFASSLS